LDDLQAPISLPNGAMIRCYYAIYSSSSSSKQTLAREPLLPGATPGPQPAPLCTTETLSRDRKAPDSETCTLAMRNLAISRLSIEFSMVSLRFSPSFQFTRKTASSRRQKCRSSKKNIACSRRCVTRSWQARRRDACTRFPRFP
jgi:hypothetical protein